MDQQDNSRPTDKQRRSYKRVSNKRRKRLIRLLKQKKSIKEAAELVGVNYENAKAIYRVYRLENRQTKHINRFRTVHATILGSQNNLQPKRDALPGAGTNNLIPTAWHTLLSFDREAALLQRLQSL